MKRSSFPLLMPLALMQAVMFPLLFLPTPAMADDSMTNQPAATGLFFLPVSPSANIYKSRANSYAFKIKECFGFERSHRRVFNTYAQTLAETANAMKPLIGSNDSYDIWTLNRLKKFSAKCFESYRTEHLKPGQKYEGKVKSLYPDCKKWFNHSADRILLDKWTDRLLQGVESSNQAFTVLAFAFKRLSKGDIEGAQDCNNECLRIIKKAEPLINDAYVGLRELKP